MNTDFRLAAAAPLLVAQIILCAPRPLLDDTFGGPSLDAGKWRLQSLAPQEYAVYDGALHLRDGTLRTRVEFLYGRVDVKAKFPGHGIPVSLRLEGPDPATHIDLATSGAVATAVRSGVASDDAKAARCTILGDAAAPEGLPPAPCGRTTDGIKRGTDFSAGFHVFSVEWTPQRLTWYVDGTSYASVHDHIPSLPMALMLTSTSTDRDGPSLTVSAVHVGKTEDADPRASF